MKNIGVFCLFFVVLPALGCSQNVKVSGKVSFSDGSPLTNGSVIFEKDAFQARGDLKPDGTFVLGSLKISDGLPRGTYNVYITGAMSSEERQIGVQGMGTDGRSSVGIPVFKHLIHKKYERPETSGLICEVKKSMKYNITVEPPQ